MKPFTLIVSFTWYLTINQINLSAQSLEPLDINSILLEQTDYLTVVFQNDFKYNMRNLFIEKGISFSRNYTFLGGLVLSNNAPDLVGANYERPDFSVFSTGRIYASELIYNSNTFNLKLGRLRPKYYLLRQSSPWNSKRISGDGFRGDYYHKGFVFSNSIEYLPSEEISEGETFDRILNFHQLSFQVNQDFTISFGEFSIYSGSNLGLNWLKSNPFIPYVVHNYDTDSSRKKGYSGDLDNYILFNEITIIKGRWEINIKSYIDEFQFDSEDRKVFADQYLVIGEIWTELTEPEKSKNNLDAVFRYSKSNIAFGIHNGVLTTYKVGAVPLLPHELGQKERLDILFSFSNVSNSFLILNYYHIKYVELNYIDFNKLNMKEYQRALKIDHNNVIDLRIGLVFKNAYNIKLFTSFKNDHIETMSIILQIVFF